MRKGASRTRRGACRTRRLLHPRASCHRRRCRCRRRRMAARARGGIPNLWPSRRRGCTLYLWRRQRRVLLAVAAAWLSCGALRMCGLLLRQRSFFGVLRDTQRMCHLCLFGCLVVRVRSGCTTHADLNVQVPHGPAGRGPLRAARCRARLRRRRGPAAPVRVGRRGRPPWRRRAGRGVGRRTGRARRTAAAGRGRRAPRVGARVPCAPGPRAACGGDAPLDRARRQRRGGPGRRRGVCASARRGGGGSVAGSGASVERARGGRACNALPRLRDGRGGRDDGGSASGARGVFVCEDGRGAYTRMSRSSGGCSTTRI